MDLMENAEAANNDSRFQALTPEELKSLEIEISLISKPKKLIYESEKEILDQIEKDKHGLTIKHGVRIASLLPSEWTKVKDKIQFLEGLCQMAKLDKDAWRSPNTELLIYETETFKE